MANVLRRSSPFPLNLQFPCEPRYGEVIRLLSTRIAAYIGYPEAEAGVVGESVDGVVQRFVSAARSDDLGARVDITFRTGATAVEIWIRYHGEVAGDGGVVGLERALRTETSPGGSLGAIRESMDGLRVGQDDDVAFCCLTRQLPPDA